MRVKIGEKFYNSSFSDETWTLENKEGKLEIPLSKIYNFFGNKVYGKTDTFTIALVILGCIFITPWIAAVFVFPVLYFWHHARRVRLDTEQGAIYVILDSIEDKTEFLKECKNNIEIQRWKNIKRGFAGDSSEPGFLSKIFNKGE